MISLEIKNVIGKMAYSKDGKKIGRIKDAKETMEKKLKVSKKYLLFQQDRFFKRPFKVAIELTDDVVQHVRIGYSMLTNAEEIGEISPGKVSYEYLMVCRSR